VAFTAARIVGPVALTTTATTLYTVPTATTVVVKSILLSNPTSADKKAYLSIGTEAQATQVIPGVVVPAADVIPLDVWLVLNAAEVLQGRSDQAGINVTISGVTNGP
jgi:hypothetical protein